MARDRQQVVGGPEGVLGCRNRWAGAAQHRRAEQSPRDVSRWLGQGGGPHPQCWGVTRQTMVPGPRREKQQRKAEFWSRGERRGTSFHVMVPWRWNRV